MRILPETFSDIPESIYGGFWRRFCALFLDFLIILPLGIAALKINDLARLNYVYTTLVTYGVSLFLYIYCVKRWGGSPGKLIMKLKIINIQGFRVHWREAILRYIVDLSLAAAATFFMITVLFEMTDAQFHAFARSVDRTKWILENTSVFYDKLTIAHQIWIGSEFVVLLCNKRKRALHDLIAGTVVIKSKYEERIRKWYTQENEMA